MLHGTRPESARSAEVTLATRRFGRFACHGGGTMCTAHGLKGREIRIHGQCPYVVRLSINTGSLGDRGTPTNASTWSTTDEKARKAKNKEQLPCTARLSGAKQDEDSRKAA